MKYFIMCGGYVCTWDKPKHLWLYEGEPILKRIIRQLKEHGIEDITVTTAKNCVRRYKKFGAKVIEYDSNTKPYHWVNAFYPLDEPVCYLFGDVVYSDNAIQTIIDAETDDIEFFASAPPFANDYPKKYAEPFAFKVVNQEKFRYCIDITKTLWENKQFYREPIAWELWQVIKGTTLNVIKYDNYTIINDYTCDLDWEDEIGQWKHNS